MGSASDSTAFAILASGTGSNALALAAAAARGEIPARLACIVCDRPGAPIIERGRAAGIDVLVLDRTDFVDRDAHEGAIVDALRERDVEHVALAGYMRICGPVFLAAYEGRTLNVHPSLLPQFPGRDAIGDAIDAGATRTGVTVHLVDAGIDTGPIVAQEAIAIVAGDDRDSLAMRIHAVEHRIFPPALAALIATPTPRHLEAQLT
ncbi:MAG: phosphoribosylglycinamide formyltransferase [Thermoleophilia bacterium]|nr:phosphoribosylglycinamide formyltransferase [Thermoleophilia bacterium]